MSKIQLSLVTLGTIATTFLGGWDIMLRLLVIMVVADYATGVLASLYLKKTSSKIGFNGIIKKVMIFAMVAVVCAVGQAMNLGGIREAVIWFYVTNELISIIENAKKIGLDVPDAFKKIISNLKRKGDGNG